MSSLCCYHDYHHPPLGSVVVMVGSWLAGFDARTGDREWTNEIAGSGRWASYCVDASTCTSVYQGFTVSMQNEIP